MSKANYTVKEDCGNAEILVLRQNGTDGEINAKLVVSHSTARRKSDYKGREHSIKFEDGEVREMINITFKVNNNITRVRFPD